MTGLEYWRAIPAQKPEHYYPTGNAIKAPSEKFPRRPMAMLILDAEQLPAVGQTRRMRLAAANGDQRLLAAVEHALANSGGIVGCLPEIEDAIGLPLGGTAALVHDIMRISDDEILLSLRGVSSIKHISATKNFSSVQDFTMLLVQEVPEWGKHEDAAGIDAIEAEILLLEGLFAECSELQRLSGYVAAGNFTSKALPERTEDVLNALDGSNLLRVCFDKDGKYEETHEFSPAMQKAVATSHALEASLSVEMRTKFLCDPRSLAPRLLRIKAFLAKVRDLLAARIAFRQAFEEPGSSDVN